MMLTVIGYEKEKNPINDYPGVMWMKVPVLMNL